MGWVGRVAGQSAVAGRGVSGRKASAVQRSRRCEARIQRVTRASGSADVRAATTPPPRRRLTSPGIDGGRRRAAVPPSARRRAGLGGREPDTIASASYAYIILALDRQCSDHTEDHRLRGGRAPPICTRATSRND